MRPLVVHDDTATGRPVSEEGGGTLSVTLSTAFLLAEDTSITAPSITHQLRAGLR